MAFSDLLDDENIQENLDTDLVLEYSKKIALRVRFLTFFFACFSLTYMLVSYEVYIHPPHRTSEIFLIFLIIFGMQGGSIFMTFRLFFYQKSILNHNNWVTIFDNKYKVLRVLAFVFLFTFLPIAYLMIDSINL